MSLGIGSVSLLRGLVLRLGSGLLVDWIELHGWAFMHLFCGVSGLVLYSIAPCYITFFCILLLLRFQFIPIVIIYLQYCSFVKE
jgi:hypothetical protein